MTQNERERNVVFVDCFESKKIYFEYQEPSLRKRIVHMKNQSGKEYAMLVRTISSQTE